MKEKHYSKSFSCRDYKTLRAKGCCYRCGDLRVKAHRAGLCIDHWFKEIYKDIKRRCTYNGPKKKNHAYRNVICLMTQNEFVDWAYHTYDPWNPTLSIDRINNGHYELENIQWLGIEENRMKGLMNAQRVRCKDRYT